MYFLSFYKVLRVKFCYYVYLIVEEIEFKKGINLLKVIEFVL